MSFTPGKRVFVPTPEHGYVEAEVVKSNKNSVTLKYVDDFIKQTYGDDDIVYMEGNMNKIVTGKRPIHWLFQNRKDFPDWVKHTFSEYTSCGEQKKSKGFEFTPQQKFIRAYLGYNSPYRGLLLYHGLGVGKTCASVATSESLKDNRNIVVFLPASLEKPFINTGLKKCADYDNDKNIKEKYSFISYNASNVIDQIERLGNLNNKVLVVDEAHNLATMMVNGIRGSSKQGYGIYKHFMEAKNSKVILLTGTPLVNTPFEIAILYNIIRGFIEVIVFRVSEFRENDIDSYMAELLKDDRIGYVDFNRKNSSMAVIMKVNSWDMEFEQTVRFVESKSRDYNAYTNFEGIDRYTIFPDDEDEFNDLFIRDDKFINKNMFQRRIVGLTSYYMMKNSENFPDKLPEKIVKATMSSHQYELYQQAREKEKKQERRTAQQLSKRKRGEKITTLARVFSREFSNFVFPEEIIRPFKKIKFMTAAMQKNANNDEKEITTEEFKTYLQDALEKVSDPSKPYLRPGKDGLSKYSPKMEEMLKEIESDKKGLILIYSFFRRVEGLEIFSRVLNNNGYSEYDGIDANYKQYAFFSGRETKKERDKVIKIITSPENKEGKIIRILLVSSAGAEGLDLKNIRKVLIMEPFWHEIRIQQVIGRAIRKQSHFNLPKEDRNVQVIRYMTIFTPEQKESSKEKISTDEYIQEVAQKKLQLNTEVLEVVREASIDCHLNQCDSTCFEFTGDKQELAFLPKINEDIIYGYEQTRERKKEITIAGLTEKDEIVYKKDGKWFLGNKEIKKVPKIIKKFGLDLSDLTLYDYKSLTESKVPIKVGKVNSSGKFSQLP
jgi:superfamily II DNA or RNA helicase